MKIAYGTPTERWLLCGAFLLAAAAAAGTLLQAQILSFPYLGLPLNLVLCAVVLCLLPTGRRSGSPLFRGLYRTLPALFLMGAIFHASSFSFPADLSVGLPDVSFHFLEFFGLGLLTARMVDPDRSGRGSLRSFVFAFSIVVGFGLLDEIHQGFVPGREPSALDLLFDALGGGLGILAYRALYAGPKRPSSPVP